MRTGINGASVGKYTYAGRVQCLAAQHGSVDIGSFCSIGDELTIILGNGLHDAGNVSTYPFGEKYEELFGAKSNMVKPSHVTIGHDVWIGNGVTIMGGLSIGDGAIIAASSHVVKDVPPYTIVGGNPAQEIRKRFSPDIINLLEQLRWWSLPEGDIRALAPVLRSHPDADKLRELVKAYR